MAIRGDKVHAAESMSREERVALLVAELKAELVGLVGDRSPKAAEELQKIIDAIESRDGFALSFRIIVSTDIFSAQDTTPYIVLSRLRASDDLIQEDQLQPGDIYQVFNPHDANKKQTGGSWNAVTYERMEGGKRKKVSLDNAVSRLCSPFRDLTEHWEGDAWKPPLRWLTRWILYQANHIDYLVPPSYAPNDEDWRQLRTSFVELAMKRAGFPMIPMNKKRNNKEQGKSARSGGSIGVTPSTHSTNNGTDVNAQEDSEIPPTGSIPPATGVLEGILGTRVPKLMHEKALVVTISDIDTKSTDLPKEALKALCSLEVLCHPLWIPRYDVLGVRTCANKIGYDSETIQKWMAFLANGVEPAFLHEYQAYDSMLRSFKTLKMTYDGTMDDLIQQKMHSVETRSRLASSRLSFDDDRMKRLLVPKFMMIDIPVEVNHDAEPLPSIDEILERVCRNVSQGEQDSIITQVAEVHQARVLHDGQNVSCSAVCMYTFG